MIVALGGCQTPPAQTELVTSKATMAKQTATQKTLQELPPPAAKIPVAVYGFEDKTGQFRPSDTGQTLSRAVTQGGDSVLIKALQDAGNREWFTVVERSSLNNLLKERQIIAEMRQRYLGEVQVNADALPPLLFAGVLLEGGIVGFDTNTLTGGAAARYLGIGGQTEYRQNVVSVYLRAVSVKTGEVLATVTTEKTISSVGAAGNAFRFVGFNELLEADVGFTSNEPGLLALRQAIEKSVYALIMEGTEVGLWDFRDASAGAALYERYQRESTGVFDVAQAPDLKAPLAESQQQAHSQQQARALSAQQSARQATAASAGETTIPVVDRLVSLVRDAVTVPEAAAPAPRQDAAKRPETDAPEAETAKTAASETPVAAIGREARADAEAQGIRTHVPNGRIIDGIFVVAR